MTKSEGRKGGAQPAARSRLLPRNYPQLDFCIIQQAADQAGLAAEAAWQGQAGGTRQRSACWWNGFLGLFVLAGSWNTLGQSQGLVQAPCKAGGSCQACYRCYQAEEHQHACKAHLSSLSSRQQGVTSRAFRLPCVLENSYTLSADCYGRRVEHGITDQSC